MKPENKYAYMHIKLVDKDVTWSFFSKHVPDVNDIINMRESEFDYAGPDFNKSMVLEKGIFPTRVRVVSRSYTYYHNEAYADHRGESSYTCDVTLYVVPV